MSHSVILEEKIVGGAIRSSVARPVRIFERTPPTALMPLRPTGTMTTFLHDVLPLQLLLATFAGWANRHLRRRVPLRQALLDPRRGHEVHRAVQTHPARCPRRSRPHRVPSPEHERHRGTMGVVGEVRVPQPNDPVRRGVAPPRSSRVRRERPWRAVGESGILRVTFTRTSPPARTPFLDGEVRGRLFGQVEVVRPGAELISPRPTVRLYATDRWWQARDRNCILLGATVQSAISNVNAMTIPCRFALPWSASAFWIAARVRLDLLGRRSSSCLVA